MNALTQLRYREQRLRNARAEIRSVFRAGDMTDSELYDFVNMLAALCSPEQAEHKARLLTIASDLDEPEPDADALKRYPGPAILDSRMERIA